MLNSVSPAPTGGITVRARLLRLWRAPAILPSLGAVAGLILFAFFLKRKGIRPLSSWRGWRQRHRDAEPARFKRCLANLRDADATSALNAAMQWLNHIQQNGRGASLTQFAADYGDEKFRQRVSQQQEGLFAQQPTGNTWDALSFERSLITARQRWLRSRRRSLQRYDDLSSLNPIHDAIT